jgi:hypothetical protein
MTPLRRYDTPEASDLVFERLWPPLKEISITKITKANFTTQQPYKKIYGLFKDHF